MLHHELQAKLDRHLSLLAQDKDNLQLLLDISSLYQELSDFNNAQSYLDKASAINRESCLGHQGLLYLNQKELDKAIHCFQEGLDYLENDALRFNLAFSYFLQAEFQQTKKTLAPLVSERYLPNAALLIARACHAQGRINEAIIHLNNLIEQYPEDAEALALLALFHYDNNDPELAQEAATNSLQLNPSIFEARMVDVLLRLPEQKTSCQEIEELLEISPNDSRLWFALGNTLLQQGQADAAIEALEKAIKVQPDFYDCYMVLAWSQLLTDDSDAAEETYQKATGIEEQFPDAWGGLALVNALLNNLWKAEMFLEQAKNLDSACFLADIAESIIAYRNNPQKQQKELVRLVNESKSSISKQLVLFMELTLEEEQQLH